MASFAKIGIGNKIERVEVVSDNIATTEKAGVDFLNNLYGSRDVWKQTFYDGGTRKNFAGVDYTYDPTLDAFIPPKPFATWILNKETCKWEAPVAYPTDGKSYSWNDENQEWQEKLNIELNFEVEND